MHLSTHNLVCPRHFVDSDFVDSEKIEPIRGIGKTFVVGLNISQPIERVITRLSASRYMGLNSLLLLYTLATRLPLCLRLRL